MKPNHTYETWRWKIYPTFQLWLCNIHNLLWVVPIKPINDHICIKSIKRFSRNSLIHLFSRPSIFGALRQSPGQANGDHGHGVQCSSSGNDGSGLTVVTSSGPGFSDETYKNKQINIHIQLTLYIILTDESSYKDNKYKDVETRDWKNTFTSRERLHKRNQNCI